MSKLLFAIAASALLFAASPVFADVPPWGEGNPGYQGDPIGLDMFNQPSMKPQKGWYGRNITYPENTVAFSIRYGQAHTTPTLWRPGSEAPMSTAEAETLENPIAADAASLQRGERAWVQYCMACHGDDGKGQVPVAEKLMAGGAPLWDVTLTIPGRSDGYLYGLIRNGGTNMPAYGAQTTPDDRWHIVNYLRSLQP